MSAIVATVVALFFVETMLHCTDHFGLLVGGHSHHHGWGELPFSNDGDNDVPASAADGHSHSAIAILDSFRLESQLPVSGMLSSPNVLPPPGAVREITLPPRLS